jgi:hypothetical protein
MVAVAVAVGQDVLFNEAPVMPANREQEWGMRLPVMRAFPRLAVEQVDEPLVEARWDEEPERWDGMA